MITTKCHKISSTKIAKMEFKRRFMDSVWLLTFPLISFAVGLFYNNAFLYIGLMLLFLIYPIVLTMSYFNTLLLPSYARGTKLRIINFGDKALSVQYMDYDENGKVQKNGQPIDIDYSELQSYFTDRNYLILRLKTAERGILIIPIDAFENNNDITNTINLLNANTLK